MGEQPTPIWHPISKLPLIAGMVVEILQVRPGATAKPASSPSSSLTCWMTPW